MLHLHHLTPINEAAERSFPEVPRIGHLHGTELLMLREIDEGPPPGWEHAAAWAERMRRWAGGCERLLVLSPDAVRRVPALLGVDPDRVVWAPNGFDPEGFDRRPVTGAARLAHWRRWLVEEPRGWDETGVPGSVAYADEQLAPFSGAVLLLYVGRYTEVKRVPLLIRAHAARARALRAAGRAGAAGRVSRASGRASTRCGRARDRQPGRVPGRLARPRGPARRAQRGRPAGAALGARAVRRGDRGGDGVRPAGARGRRLRARPRSSTRGRPAGSSRRTTRRRWPMRWWRPSTTTPSAGGAASAPTRWRAGATRGRRWRAASRRSTARSREGRPPSAGARTLTSALTAIPYRIRRSDRARRARILVDGEGVEVVVPQRFPLRDVEPFVEEKRAWIERTLRRMREAEAELPPRPAGRRRRGAVPGRAAAPGVRVERRRMREHVARRGGRAAAGARAPGATRPRRARALVPAPRARGGGAAARRRRARARARPTRGCRSAASARAGRPARRPAR